MLIALPLCGPSFAWHHRTQMTSWEARGFQQQHLALWQMVRPSRSQLGLPPDVSHTSVCELPPTSAKMFWTRRIGRSLSKKRIYVFPSGAIFYTEMPGTKRHICMYYQGHLPGDLGCWLGDQSVEQISLCPYPSRVS